MCNLGYSYHENLPNSRASGRCRYEITNESEYSRTYQAEVNLSLETIWWRQCKKNVQGWHRSQKLKFSEYTGIWLNIEH